MPSTVCNNFADDHKQIFADDGNKSLLLLTGSWKTYFVYNGKCGGSIASASVYWHMFWQ